MSTLPLLPPSAAITPNVPSAFRKICGDTNAFAPFAVYRTGWSLCSTM